MTRLWRRNSPDSTPPTTASKVRPFGAGQNNGDSLARSLLVEPQVLRSSDFHQRGEIEHVPEIE